MFLSVCSSTQASNSPLGHMPATEDSSEGIPLWQMHCLVGTKDALVHEIEGLPDMEHIFHTALPEWVYLRVRAHIMHDLLQDWLACLPAVHTFCNKAIMESVPMDDGHLLKIGEDELNAYLFDIGDWVTPQIGVYEGDIGCIIRYHGQFTVEVSHAQAMLWRLKWKAWAGAGDYVEVFAGEQKGRSGYVQGVHNPVLIDVLQGAASKGVGQIGVHRNSVAIIAPLQIAHTVVKSPEEISWRMWMCKVPWVGLHVFMLPAIENSKKHPVNYMAARFHANTDQANNHKGKIGTVLDVNIDQTLYSGLRVYVCLEQNYNSSHAFSEISPPPPRPVTPLHERPSEDSGTGNTWDITVPEPPDPRTFHWSRDPWLAQHQLQVNIERKSQPQKALLELSGTRCNIKIMFRTTLTNVLNLAGVTPVEPTVCDFHHWVIIKGPHISKYIHGIHYVQGSKPILWIV
ncbi:hypothetical protein IW262DRAFT_1297582 [Armillaria fumosa]|nr:hypothetical protein IW262DRAFT_1297582 [Armillaria fumosa]